MSYTFVELEVSWETYEEIEKLLREADYEHAFLNDTIDMRGLGLVRRSGAYVDFRSAVIDELVCAGIYQGAHDTDPKKAIADLIAWHMEVALDPAVSTEARRLLYTQPPPGNPEE